MKSLAVAFGASLFSLAILSACQTTTDNSAAATATAATQAPEAPVRMEPVSYSEMKRLFGGRSFAVPNEKLNGNEDRFKRSITFWGDNGRAYRYYPHWTKTGLDYYALGTPYRGKLKGPKVVEGKSYRNLDQFCLRDELSRNSVSCETVFRKGDRFYLLGEADNEILFSDGYDNLLTPLVKRAVKDDNNRLLWALAQDFRTLEPDLQQKYRVANMRVWAKNVEAERELQAELKRQADERRARERAQAAEQERRRQAECQRKTGKPCPDAGGGLIGWVVEGAITAVSEAASQPAPAYIPCHYGDTCYRITGAEGRKVTAQCTKGTYAGREVSVCANEKGRWASGCGLTDTFAHHYKNATIAVEKACDL